MIEQDKEEFKKALHSGLKSLSTKSRTCYEFRALLKRRGFQKEVIAQVIEHLRHLNYLNDKKYALQYSVTQARRRLWGRLKIEQELRKRGITERDIDLALQEWHEEINEKEILSLAVKKKLKTLGKLNDEKKTARLYKYLNGKGFLREDIMAQLKRLTEMMNHEDK